jgi:hypothetical protein
MKPQTYWNQGFLTLSNSLLLTACLQITLRCPIVKMKGLESLDLAIT